MSADTSGFWKGLVVSVGVYVVLLALAGWFLLFQLWLQAIRAAVSPDVRFFVGLAAVGVWILALTGITVSVVFDEREGPA